MVFVPSFQAQTQAFAGQQQQQAQPQPSASVAAPAESSLPYPIHPESAASAPVYPGLGDYMGMELTEEVIRANMPEYLPQPAANQQPGGSSASASSVASRPQVSFTVCSPSTALLGFGGS